MGNCSPLVLNEGIFNMDFPHIDDTKFPNLNNVDVYKFQNDFDYARWTGKVSIKLLNVLWNSDYADVPGFDSDKERDDWFDAQEGIVHVLESAFNVTPDNDVRIPVPYNDAYRYNYLMVDMPMQTSADKPIDFENEKTRVKRWYYFINSMKQYSPNTTELRIKLDEWTTFSHTVEIPYLMLERGHAPMMKTDVVTFLNNPIQNNEYLLAEDFNYGGDSKVISKTNYIPIGNGTKYVLFALPMTKTDILAAGIATALGASTPPTFSSTEERWGNQIVVNDYAWNYGNADYSSCKLDITSMLSDEAVFNGNYMFAVSADDAHNFFNMLATKCVHLLHAIQACYMVAKDMLKFTQSFTFGTYTIYQCDKNYSSDDIELTKEYFNFDSKYEDITKLYTYPYSIIEVTDDNGFKREVRIENTGKIGFHKEVALCFPYVRYQTFFTGFNGEGDLSYVWKNIHDSDIKKTMWEDDFSSYMMKWDIPTFGIYVSSEAEYGVNNYAPMKAAREGAIIAYKNPVRFANTNRENVADSYATATANVNATMTTADANNETACDTAEDIILSVHNIALEDMTTHQNDKIDTDAGIATGLNYYNTQAQVDYAAVAYANSGSAALQNAGIGAVSQSISGAVSGASYGGGTGMLGGAIAGGINGISNIAQTGVTYNALGANLVSYAGKEQSMADNFAAGNAAYASNATTQNTNLMHVAQREGSQTVNKNNTSARTQMARNVATNNANAARTQATETSNATYTRNAVIVAEQDNLRQRQREWEAKYKSKNLDNPVLETDFTGDAFPDVYERRGVRFNVRTQTKAAIAQAGDAFLRYGYTLHRVWDMSNGFHYGKHFTFWKAEDIWINEGTGLAGNSVNAIADILRKGVTVWRNPNEIGKVSIYDNI